MKQEIKKIETISEHDTTGIEIHTEKLELVLWAKTPQDLEKVIKLYNKNIKED